jgi:RNA polymerase sigma-70 factor, ECF subfamily
VRADDKRAEFEALALPLLDSLYNFACWLCRNEHEAEDIVQESLVKAWKGFGGFTLGTNFRAWMFRIVRNTFLNSRTGLARQATVPIEDDQEFAVDDTPESALLASIESDRLQHAIAELPLNYQEVLLLADVEEMKYAEIAEALSVPIGTVMSRLSRARQRVRTSLQKEAYGRGV